MKKKTGIAGAALALALIAAACGGNEETTAPSAPAPAPAPTDVVEAECGLELLGECIADADLWERAQAEGGLTLYTSLSEARELVSLADFESQTGLKVDYVRMTGAGLYERVQTEHAAGGVQADVIRDTDIALNIDHMDAGVYQPYCPRFIDLIPQEIVIRDCLIISSLAPVVAISYNTELVSSEDAPKTWEDMLDERWAGQIGIVEIGAGGSTWARDLYLRQVFGLEYWERLAALKPIVLGTHGALTEAQARGEFAVAFNLPGGASLAMEKGAPLAIVFPPEGVPAYNLWIGMSSGATNVAAAQVFLNWTFSLAGQTAVGKAGDFPMRPDAPAPVLFKTVSPDPATANLYYTETFEEFITLRPGWTAEWYDLIDSAR